MMKTASSAARLLLISLLLLVQAMPALSADTNAANVDPAAAADPVHVDDAAIPDASAPSSAPTPAPTVFPRAHIETVPTELSHPEPLPDLIIKRGQGNKLQLQAQVQKDQDMDIVNGKAGFDAKPEGKDPLPAKVAKVLPGSLVAARGIVPGDRLISEVRQNDGSVTLTMEHAGQAMRFTLKAADLAAALTAKLDDQKPLESKVGKDKLTSNLTTTNDTKVFRSMVDVMVNHDLDLIIDRSGSMNTRDCPSGLSRWEWCCQEATELAKAAQLAASSIDASIFNGDYVTYQHISPAQIPEIFATNRPGGGTEPAYALQEQMENYFKSRRAKPLTIVMVTDGLPNHPSNIAEILKEESKKIRYQGEVTLTVLLISNEVDEQRLRQRIGLTPDSSVKSGGFVDIVPFSELEHKGIGQALFEDLKVIRLATDARRASRASETALGGQNLPGPGLPYGGGPGWPGSYPGSPPGFGKQLRSHSSYGRIVNYP